MSDATEVDATPRAWAIYEGVRFVAPFLCMCCGIEVEVRQWAFGRTCGKCDTGICQPWHKRYDPKEYGHEEPAWLPRGGGSRDEKMARFMEYASHNPIPALISEADR